MAKNKVTIKDVARMAGISVSSVSRILNQTGRYSKETEERVLRIVKETGYTVNTAARSLRNVQTKTVMLMVPDITNEFFARIAYYVEKYLHGHGYTTFICNTDNNEDRVSQFVNEAVSKNVDGIIGIADFFNLPKSYEVNPIPIVTIDRHNKRFSSVRNIEVKSGLDAADYLYQHGSRHIIGIFPEQLGSWNETRYQGFLQYMSDHPECYKGVYQLKIGQNSHEEAEALVYSLLDQGQPIDGIFCGSDRLAMGAYYAVVRKGLRIPEDVQIIGYDNAIYSRITVPTLTTIGRNTKKMAHAACDLLLKQIDDPSLEVQKERVPTRLIIRQSTRN